MDKDKLFETMELMSPSVNTEFVINPETREITVPETEKLFGVESDDKTERKYFRCKKIVGDNIDLSQLGIRINYRNANGEKDQYICEDVAVDGEDITFSWLLRRKVTKYKGDISFIVCAVKTEESGIITNEWNTTLATGQCLEGLEVSISVDEPTKDIIQQLLDITKKTSDEAVKAVTAEGEKQVAAVNEAAQGIIADRQQIQKNKEELEEALEVPIDVSDRIDLYCGANGYLKPTTSNFTLSTPIEIPPHTKIGYKNIVVNLYIGKFCFADKKDIQTGETIKAVTIPGMQSEIVSGYIEIPEGYKYLFIASNTNKDGIVIAGDSYFFIKDSKKMSKQIIQNTTDIETNRKKIEEIKNHTRNKILFLPEKYNLVVGDTFELFWKGIILSNNYLNYNIKVTCDVGNVYRRKFMFTPKDENIGTKTLKIELYDDGEKLLDSGTVNLVIKAKAQNPSTVKNVLCVGDSLLVNGVWAAESHRRLTKTGGNPEGDNLTNVKYIGTMQKDGAGYEGNGGWTFGNYNAESKSPAFVWITTTHNKTGDDQHSIYRDTSKTEWKIETIEVGRLKMIRVKGSGTMPTNGVLIWVSGGANHDNIVFSASEIAAGNPFWNEKTGKVDFAEYAKKVNASSIDYCYILLGWNSSEWGINKTITEAKKFINSLLGNFPICKVVLLGLEVPSLDGFGENYGSAWNWYEKTKYVHELDTWYAEIAKYNANVTSVNISGQLDTENNMITGTRAVNTRNVKAETYQTNGVHPAESGYLQIADAVYRDLTHKLQS